VLIGDDAVRPLHAHLRAMGHVEKLDLFIYSRGGAIDVPWRVVSALRQMSDEWNILIPFRANSAATLLALGADEIVMGMQGELGPIDPIMSVSRMIPQPGGGHGLAQDNISVEDVIAYTKFVQERAGLADQPALSAALGKLTDRVDAVALGSVYRTHLHIRDVARRMLTSRKNPPTEEVIGAIVENHEPPPRSPERLAYKGERRDSNPRPRGPHPDQRPSDRTNASASATLAQ
jgi:ClpP class serine protease